MDYIINRLPLFLVCLCRLQCYQILHFLTWHSLHLFLDKHYWYACSRFVLFCAYECESVDEIGYHNHMIWKYLIMTYMTIYGFEGILDSSLICPLKFIGNSTFPNSIFLNWNKLTSLSNDGSIVHFHLVCLAT